MKNKIFLCMLLLFSGISMFSGSSEASIHASMYDASSLDQSSYCDPNNRPHCFYNLVFTIDWTLSFPPTTKTLQNLGLYVYSHGGLVEPIGGGNQGSVNIGLGHGDLGDMEDGLNNEQNYLVAIYQYQDGSTITEQSNIA